MDMSEISSFLELELTEGRERNKKEDERSSVGKDDHQQIDGETRVTAHGFDDCLSHNHLAEGTGLVAVLEAEHSDTTLIDASSAANTSVVPCSVHDCLPRTNHLAEESGVVAVKEAEHLVQSFLP